MDRVHMCVIAEMHLHVAYSYSNSYSNTYSIWHGKAVQPTGEPEAHEPTVPDRKALKDSKLPGSKSAVVEEVEGVCLLGERAVTVFLSVCRH
jgi:hypothetical protein